MSWAENSRFWITMPKRALILFLAGVFCIFGSFGFVGTAMNPHALDVRLTLLWMFISGMFAACWALFGTRRMVRSMIALGLVQFAGCNMLSRLMNQGHMANLEEMRRKTEFCGTGAMMLIIAGYVLFVMFFRAEGMRFFAAHTEVKLAGEIHRTLVPEFSLARGRFEFYGASQPSGEVGGDLVDVVEEQDAWIGYVADVSGHGVAAGVLMAMVKSAARMTLRCNGGANFLADINEVLKPLIAPNMFVTFGCLMWRGGAEMRVSLAGHPPILHYQMCTHSVIEHSTENFPLGLFAGKSFDEGTLTAEPGDVLAILTDGLPETDNEAGEDLGLDPLKTILVASHDRPLSEIFRDLRSCGAKHGRQVDDQSILLIRVRQENR